MAPRKRWFYLGALSIAYVALFALRAADAGPSGWLAFAALVVAFAAGWARPFSGPPGQRPENPTAHKAMRWCLWGSCLSFAAALGPGDPSPAADFQGTPLAIVAHAALIVCLASAVAAATRLDPPAGLLDAPRARRRVSSPLLVLLIGAAGVVALGLATPLGRANPLLTERAAHDIAIASALTAFTVMLVVVGLARWQRRFELGNAERIRTAFAGSVACLSIGSAVVALGLASATATTSAAAVSAALVTSLSCVVRGPVRLARMARIATPAIALGTPLILVATVVAETLPNDAPVLLLGVATSVLLLGLAAPTLAERLAPEQHAFLHVVASAQSALSRTLPDEALSSTLGKLRALAGTPTARVELFRLHPPSVIIVDLADYTHEATAILPAAFVELAQKEPEQILRLDVLEALEVRRPDVRPVTEWMRARHALCAVLLSDGDGPTGALVLPAGARTTPLMLEEAQALRGLADAMSALTIAASAIARSQAREASVAHDAQSLASELERADALARRALARQEVAVARLARSARAAAYGPAARLCLERLERLAAEESPLALLTPVGSDARPYAAVAHLASRRKAGPLLIVDASDPAEQRLESWADPVTSPLVLADGGTLFVLDASVLGADAQTLVGDLLHERRAPGKTEGSLDVRLVVSVAATVDTLVASGRLSPRFADLLGDRAVPIPPLAARGEDMRAIVLERLAEASSRWRGRPIGIDAAALARLTEHAWPGNDLELDALLTRATITAVGDVLNVADLERLGFVPIATTARRPSTRPERPENTND